MTSFLRKLFGKPTTIRNTPKPAAKTRLQLTTLEDREVPATVTMSSGGGPIIPNVQVEAVYLGSAWANTADPNYPALHQERQDMDRFLSDIVQSDYMNGLAQYYGWVPGFWGIPSLVQPGKGQFVGDDVVNVNLGTGPVSTSTIQNDLAMEVLYGRLASPNTNTFYVVIMPPGVTAAADAGTGGGEHTTFQLPYLPYSGWNGKQMHYATIEDGRSGFSPTGLTGTATPFQKMTYVTSHELAEAVSDPEGNGWQATRYDAYGNPIPHSGWYENGDVTQDLATGNGAMAIEHGYLVQKYWSKNDNTSIAPGAAEYSDLSTIPVGIAGAAFDIQSLGSWTHSTSLLRIGTVTISTLRTTASFDATYTVGTTTYNTHGTLRLLGRSVAITVTNPVTGGVLYTGILTPADGNWTGGSLELLGTNPSDPTNMNNLTSFGVLYARTNASTLWASAMYTTTYTSTSGGGGYWGW